MPIAIVVHGGAGTISADRIGIAQNGCKEAALIGWRILQTGGSALDAVEAAVRALEDNPNYNAGTGSCLTADGNIEMDAGMMEGSTLQAGAVAVVERIKNPIVLARRVLESPHILLMGRGAIEFALEQNMTLCKREDLLTERQYNNWLSIREERIAETQAMHGNEPAIHRREIGSLPARIEQEQDTSQPLSNAEEKHGTVGAVAIDMLDRLAAATSTGGMPYKYPGRVGDSPLIGGGFYADENAAVSCTGHGEDFMRLLIAKRAADGVARGLSAREAAEATIATLSAKAQGTGGLIVIDRLGNIGFSWNSQNMVYSYLSQDMTDPAAGA